MNAAELVASYVILEVGAGRYDELRERNLESVVDRRVLQPNEHYIGIDLGAAGGTPETGNITPGERDAHMRQDWHRLQNERAGERITFFQADGTALPLADNSADEVVFGYGTPNEPGELLSEAMRVVKPTGVVVMPMSFRLGIA